MQGAARDRKDSLARYDLRDAQELIDRMAAQHPLIEGTVLVALVHQPALEQRLVVVRDLTPLLTLLPPAPHQGYDPALSDLLCSEAQQLPIPPASDESTSILVTVVVRRGINGWGPQERRMSTGWHYSNHLTDAVATEIVVVTEHGWCSLWSETGGASPALKSV